MEAASPVPQNRAASHDNRGNDVIAAAETKAQTRAAMECGMTSHGWQCSLPASDRDRTPPSAESAGSALGTKIVAVEGARGVALQA